MSTTQTTQQIQGIETAGRRVKVTESKILLKHADIAVESAAGYGNYAPAAMTGWSVTDSIDKEEISVKRRESLELESIDKKHSDFESWSLIVVDVHKNYHACIISDAELDRDDIDDLLEEPRELFLMHERSENADYNVAFTRIK